MNIRDNNHLLYSLALFFIMAFVSCGDIRQDLYLNADGSGTLEATIEAGELMNMAQGFEDVGSDQDTFTDDFVPDTIVTPDAPPKDAMTLLMEKITDPTHNQDFDTMMSFLSIMADSVREKEKRKDLTEKMFIRMRSPALSADLTFGLLMKFDNTAQLKEMIDYMETLNQSSNIMAESSPVGMDSKTFMVFEADMRAGIIKVDTVFYTGFMEEMGLSQDTMMNSEDLSMMEMMFGNSKIKSVIHVPGEVIACSNPDAILTKDNKVILEYPMMDVIRRGKIDGYSVQFKPQQRP